MVPGGWHSAGVEEGPETSQLFAWSQRDTHSNLVISLDNSRAIADIQKTINKSDE